MFARARYAEFSTITCFLASFINYTFLYMFMSVRYVFFNLWFHPKYDYGNDRWYANLNRRGGSNYFKLIWRPCY